MKQYEDAKVISNITTIQKTLTTLSTKEQFDLMMREISKLKEESQNCKEDMLDLRELLAKLQKNFDDFADATNKDVGVLKGNFKWAEDQIAMIKKMLRK